MGMYVLVLVHVLVLVRRFMRMGRAVRVIMRMLAVVHPGIRVLMSVTVAMRVGVGVGVTVIVPLCRIGAGLGLERQGVLAHD